MRSPQPSPSIPSIVMQRTHDLKSRMRESRTSGSVGAPGGRLPGATRLFFCGVHRWALTRVPPAELVPLVPLLASPARFHVGVEPDSSAVHEDLVPDDVLLVARRAGEQIGQGVGRLGGCEDMVEDCGNGESRGLPGTESRLALACKADRVRRITRNCPFQVSPTRIR